MTEEELVQGCVKNKRAFQEAFYRKFFPAMMGMCRRYTQDQEVAMTIVNNGFLKAFKNMSSFSFQGSLEGWVRKIVYRCMADYFRSGRNKVHFLIFKDFDKTNNPDGIDNLYIEDIFRLMEKIPKQQADVFRLFAIEGYSHKEVGDTLNIKESTSRWYLSEARKKLRELIFSQNKINYVEK